MPLFTVLLTPTPDSSDLVTTNTFLSYGGCQIHAVNLITVLTLFVILLCPLALGNRDVRHVSVGVYFSFLVCIYHV